MKKTDLAKLFAMISTAYSNFELTPEKISLWDEMLREMSFEEGMRNLREHILTNRFPPTIADIVRKDADWISGDRLSIEETYAQLDEMDTARQLAIDCPKHLRPKLLRGGTA